MMKRFASLILVCIGFYPAAAQPDTTRLLSLNEYLSIVAKYHPLARQADLIPKEALAQLRIARGGFDPVIYSGYDSKTFDGTNYYSYFENSVNVPAWYGIELKAGYDLQYGDRINPETKIPDAGQGYLGLSVPLLKNMLMDKRRADLKKAKLFREASQFDRSVELNDLFLEAIYAYYNWAMAYMNLQTFRDAVSNNDNRVSFTRSVVQYGDRAAIDTVEAITQLQGRQLQWSEAWLRWQASTWEVSNFLWFDADTPMELDSAIVPDTAGLALMNRAISLAYLDSLEMQLQTNHPLLQSYQYKIQQLDLERRLATEDLKPVLNVDYYLLNTRAELFSDPSAAMFANNYKFGLTFGFPLTFAQGRGKVQQARIKIQDAQLSLQQKTLELLNKLRTCYAELINLQQQIDLQRASLANFQKLLAGEETRFRNGESSLFLVNARENKVIEARIKLTELSAKYYQTEAAIKWATGILALP